MFPRTNPFDSVFPIGGGRGPVIMPFRPRPPAGLPVIPRPPSDGGAALPPNSAWAPSIPPPPPHSLPSDTPADPSRPKNLDGTTSTRELWTYVAVGVGLYVLVKML